MKGIQFPIGFVPVLEKGDGRSDALPMGVEDKVFGRNLERMKTIL
jgi:hypothetical protein